MKTITRFQAWVRFATVVLLPLLAAVRSHAAPVTVQTIALNPGWNAISTTVVPNDATLSTVFAGLPVESVWTYDNETGSPDFVQEVTEEALAKTGWRSWMPTNRIESFQNDLFSLQVNRAYLIKVEGTNTVNLNLLGRPSFRKPAWKPDAFNFIGFPLDPAVSITFQNFFSPSPAHYTNSPSGGGLQPIYRLNPAGVWTRVASTDLMNAAEALWVYCKGGSDYVAPLAARLEWGDGLDFGVDLDSLLLEVGNLRSAAVNVTVRDLNFAGANPLSQAVRLGDATLTWPQLPNPMVRVLAASTWAGEQLSVRRADMNIDVFETVLEITDGAGTRLLLPVSAERAITASGAGVGGDSLAKAAKTGKSLESASHAGLWVGTVTLNAVSEAHSGTLVTNIDRGFTVSGTNVTPNSVSRTNVSLATTPTGTDFRFRLILHVDSSGNTRLLKEVIQMWQDGTSTNDTDGFAVTASSGRTILVTDESKIPNFTGVTARDGVIVGRRVSSAAFDFADNELPMAGDFSVGSSVTCTATLSESFARNPFKHRYHPDHSRGFDITRVIEVALSAAPTNAPPGYGERILDGVYKETVSGLHRTNIVVNGTFRLNRLATTGVLNQ